MAGRALRPLALIATAVVLVAFALGGWVPVARITVPPSRSTAAPKPATDPGRAQAEKARIDVDAVVDKLRHRVTPADDGSLAAHGEQYRARFDATGFGFTLDDRSSRFGVSLRGVQRGGDALALVPGAWRGEGNVAVRGLGSGMTERVTARAGELEWDVVLDRPLPGTGGLRVEAELRGLDGVPARVTDPPAWRFPLGDGATARMGEVVVKDAAGVELQRALPQVRGGTLRLVVPASVLAGAVYPLTIDPTVGPEQPVGDTIYNGAIGSQHAPAVAWNGTDYLVVWEDARAIDSGSSNYSDIYGTRVSAAGVVLDPSGIPISPAAGSQYLPAVAWNGTNFLVVWQAAGGGYDISGARVSPAGTVLDPAGIPISTAANSQSYPAVAASGANFLVVWEDSRSNISSGWDTYGARVSAAGTVLDPSGIAISTAADDQRDSAVAWDGTNFLVVWSGVRGARVSSAGVVLDPAGITIATSGTLPAVAWNGTAFLVVWEDYRSGSVPDIYGTRVSAAGVVLDPSGIPISTAANGQYEPAVAWNGTDYLVVWADYRAGAGYDIYGARVSTAGSVLDPAGIPISTAAGGQRFPAVASDGTGFLAVWTSDGDIRAARVSSAGSALDPGGIPISTAVSTQSGPAVAWNGTDFLVVWQDSRSDCRLCGTRVSGGGTVLDPAGIPISTGMSAGYGDVPVVAWNGTDFLVVHSGRGTRVSSAGTVLDPGGFPIGAGDFPAVASNGTDFLVVWQAVYDIRAARVSGAGSVLDPTGIPIATGTKIQTQAAVAWNGSNYLVVWGEGTPADVYGARVSSAGSVLDPAGIPISTAASHQQLPAVASWGDDFFVVWQDFRSGTSRDIYGAGVDGDGTVVQPSGIPISTAAGDQTAPDLAVRYHFLVAWRDTRSGTNQDIYAARVRPSGVVEEPNGVLVAGSSIDEGAPALAGGPGATWRIAYDRFVPEPEYRVNRVFMRSVSPK